MIRRLALSFVIAIALPVAALAGEVLVLTTATRIDPVPISARRGVEVQNNGPNNITCQLRTATGLTTTKGRLILPGEAWALAAGSGTSIHCIATSANQVTGAATNVTEVQ